jgi:hypothetical protein
MIGTYDKKLWEQLAATISGQPGWTARSTTGRVASDSTSAIGISTGEGTTNIYVMAATEKETGLTHIMYRYSS